MNSDFKIQTFVSQSQYYHIYGKIIPERFSFSHDLRFLKLPIQDKVLDLEISVVNNQLFAILKGDLGGQSISEIKRIVRSAENLILNSYAFTSGVILEVDLISIIATFEDKKIKSKNYYLENVHDAILYRKPALDQKMIIDLCLGEYGGVIGKFFDYLKYALQDNYYNLCFAI